MQFELNPLNYVNAHTHGLWGSLWGSWILYVDGLHDARCSGSRPHSKCVFCYFSVGSAKRWYICRTDGCMQEVPLLSVFFSASIIRIISRIFPGTNLYLVLGIPIVLVTAMIPEFLCVRRAGGTCFDDLGRLCCTWRALLGPRSAIRHLDPHGAHWPYVDGLHDARCSGPE